MKKTNYGYGLDQLVEGKSVIEYLSELIEKNDKKEIEIERGNLSIKAINMRTKHSRACMDAVNLGAKLAREDAREANFKAELAELRAELAKTKLALERANKRVSKKK